MSKDIFSILYSITSIQDLYMYAGTRDSVQECLSNLIAFLLGLGGMSRTQYIKKRDGIGLWGPFSLTCSTSNGWNEKFFLLVSIL